jgi:16S rRNA G966 N2-methylase RsmD
MSLSALIGRMRYRAFDIWNGVDTAGDASLDRFTISGVHKSEATFYAPVDSKVLHRALSSAAIDYSQYVFIDLGSGKGKCLLEAAAWPFRRVIGVEFAQELHLVALRNLQRWPRSKVKCRGISLELGDAAEFQFPNVPLAVCLFNPFTGTVMKRVLYNLIRSVKTQPRDVVILYLNPKQESIVLGTPGIEVIEKAKYYSLYRLN